MASSHRVLYTYELIEAILLESTSFEILVAYHVCETWRAIVVRSQRITDRLLDWYLPTTMAPIVTAIVRGISPFLQMPLTGSLFYAFLRNASRHTSWLERRNSA
jgi:hypothetical protein